MVSWFSPFKAKFKFCLIYSRLRSPKHYLWCMCMFCTVILYILDKNVIIKKGMSRLYKQKVTFSIERLSSKWENNGRERYPKTLKTWWIWLISQYKNQTKHKNQINRVTYTVKRKAICPPRIFFRKKVNDATSFWGLAVRTKIFIIHRNFAVYEKFCIP